LIFRTLTDTVEKAVPSPSLNTAAEYSGMAEGLGRLSHFSQISKGLCAMQPRLNNGGVIFFRESY
jgi:hypothetical protein